MRFVETGGPYGDQMCSYDVMDYKATTVEDFIREVLIERPDEWGVFEVINKKLPFYPRYGYQNGEFGFFKLHTDIYNATVIKVTAHGGWSNMDYTIYT